MEKELESKLKYLGLKLLLSNWEQTIAAAEHDHVSYSRLMTEVIEKEYAMKKELARVNRIKRAGMPEQLCIETYPFELQPKLSKKRIMQAYDSREYIHKKTNIAFIGPTGCGKSGLASSFLTQALNKGYSGRFVEFPDLVGDLLTSIADNSQKKMIQKFASYDILVVDEIGYVEMEPTQVGLFYTLMNKRHKKTSTIITSNLGVGCLP